MVITDSEGKKVCGTDGQTYPSECHMKIAACKKYQYIVVANKGDCGKHLTFSSLQYLKVAFFQKVRFAFQIFESQKKIFQKTILSLKFKFQAQDSFLEYFFLRFSDHITFSEKKQPLV